MAPATAVTVARQVSFCEEDDGDFLRNDAEYHYMPRTMPRSVPTMGATLPTATQHTQVVGDQPKQAHRADV